MWSNDFLTRRAIVTYAAFVLIAGILTPIVWGLTGGAVMGLSVVRDPAYSQEVLAFLKEKGIDTSTDRTSAQAAVQNLSVEDKEQLAGITNEAMTGVNWFYLTVFASVLVFSFVGILAGFLSKNWLLAGLIPLILLLTGFSIFAFRIPGELPMLQKALVVVFAQVGVCYAFALLGARLGLRWSRRPLQPTS